MPAPARNVRATIPNALTGMLAWACIFACAAVPAAAQAVSHKGFLDVSAVAYPQTTAADRTRIVAEALLRVEAWGRPVPALKIDGAVDLRADTHGQTLWRGIDWTDRGVARPALSVRRFDVTYSSGSLTISAGKQFVRWGRTDTVNPTDRFAPRDFLTVFDNDYLAVTAARVTIGGASDSIDVVAGRFTPSRIPLLDQRWSGSDPPAGGWTLNDRGVSAPARIQTGARWNHIGNGFEFSLSGFSGNNTLPAVKAGPVPVPAGERPVFDVTRTYPRIWVVGGDAAVPTGWLTAKAEVAYVGSGDRSSDEYLLYVFQAERQFGECLVIVGYVGEWVSVRRTTPGFAFDRGLTKALLGRVSYTIDPNRSLALDAAVRQDASGSWVRAEYSQASGEHLRLTARVTWIRGGASTFFGRFSRNSNVALSARYSF